MVLINYKYTKSFFPNTLRCNHLPTKKKKTQNNIIFYTRLARIFNFFEVRVFIVVMLKNLAFSISKSYFIYFTTSLYNTPNIKCSFFFTTSFTII